MSKNNRPTGPPAATSDQADLQRAALVRLKPVLGIPPGTYLTVIYGFVLIVALFLVILYPGLHTPGGRIEVTATPPNVTITLDDQLAGTTPLAVDAASGTHELTFMRAGFEPETRMVEVPSRVIGTIIWRKRVKVHAKMRLIDGTKLLRRHVAEFAGSSHANEIILDAGRALSQASPGDKYSFIYNMAQFIDRRQALGWLIQAAATAASDGGLVTPQTARILFEWFARLDHDYQGLPLWLSSALPDELRKPLSAQGWFTMHADAYRRELTAYRPPGRPAVFPEAFSVNGIGFRAVPSGTLLMGDDVDRTVPPPDTHDHQPHLREVAPFMMAETEISNRQFAQFVAEVPRWAPNGAALLVSEGVAEPTYLSSWEDGQPPSDALDKPVTHVSYQAAAAFAAWLNTTLPKSPELSPHELTVRLPTEAEWEWAARGGLSGNPYPNGLTIGKARLAGSKTINPGPAPTSQPNGYGLYDLLGNVWEWTNTWYAPASYLLAAGAGTLAGPSIGPSTGAEKVVRGGSWATRRELIRLHSRGAQEPSWTTPYLGFRVVIAPRVSHDA